jgi:hypothetical protein
MIEPHPTDATPLVTADDPEICEDCGFDVIDHTCACNYELD